MKFITLKDLTERIKSADLDVLTGGDITQLDRAERNAISTAKGYLNKRFDVASIFIDVLLYDEFSSYTSGSIVDTGRGLFQLNEDIGPTTIYNILDEYVVDDLLYFPNDTGEIWKVLANTVAGDSPYGAASAKFKLITDADPREASLVKALVDFMIYDLHGRANVRAFPEFRQIAYDDAMKFFKMCSDPRNGITPESMTLKTHPEKQGNDITYGGQDRFQNSNTF